jgi:hypothetical protein
MLKMNKRGQLAIFMIFLAALVLSGMALFSFFSFGSGFSGNSKAISELISEIEFSEKYVSNMAELIGEEAVAEFKGKEGDLKEIFVRVAEERDLRNGGVGIESFGNFFGKVRNGDFVFAVEGEEFVLKIDGLFAQASRGKSEIIRKFDIEKRFD